MDKLLNVHQSQNPTSKGGIKTAQVSVWDSVCREYSLMQYLVGIYSWFYKLLFFTYTDGLRKVKRMPWMVITTPSKSWCICAGVLSHVQLFVTLWIVASQAPLCMGFSRREYRSGLSFPPPGDLPDPEIKLVFPESPALAGRFFTTEPPGKPN